MKLSFLLVVSLHCQLTSGQYSQTIQKCGESGIKSSDINHQTFLKFIRVYNRNYKTPAECSSRFKNFLKNLDLVKRLRKDENGTAVYGINQFIDLSETEMERHFGGAPPEKRGLTPLWQSRQASIPEIWDWRKKGVLNPAVNQLTCGSCYAFSVVANVEAMYAITFGKLLKLSEQQIVDCNTDNQGCLIGTAVNSASYVVNFGLELEKDYPYANVQQKCNRVFSKIVVRPNGFIGIEGDERLMAEFLHLHGPMIAYVNAHCLTSYIKGIIVNANCGTGVNHNVVIVGYGVSVGPNGIKIPYWVVRNSWGPKWGEHGYFRVLRNSNTLGIGQFGASVFFK